MSAHDYETRNVKRRLSVQTGYRRCTKGPWTSEEDAALVIAVEKFGAADWASQIAPSMPTRRTGKQCRERWCNQLDPMVKKGPLEDFEADFIKDQVKSVGCRWSLIARLLNREAQTMGVQQRRTDNDIKNRYYSRIKKQVEEERRSLKREQRLSNKRRDSNRSSTSSTCLADGSPRPRASLSSISSSGSTTTSSTSSTSASSSSSYSSSSSGSSSSSSSGSSAATSPCPPSAQQQQQQQQQQQHGQPPPLQQRQSTSASCLLTPIPVSAPSVTSLPGIDGFQAAGRHSEPIPVQSARPSLHPASPHLGRHHHQQHHQQRRASLQPRRASEPVPFAGLSPILSARSPRRSDAVHRGIQQFGRDLTLSFAGAGGGGGASSSSAGAAGGGPAARLPQAPLPNASFKTPKRRVARRLSTPRSSILNAGNTSLLVTPTAGHSLVGYTSPVVTPLGQRSRLCISSTPGAVLGSLTEGEPHSPLLALAHSSTGGGSRSRSRAQLLQNAAMSPFPSFSTPYNKSAGRRSPFPGPPGNLGGLFGDSPSRVGGVVGSRTPSQLFAGSSELSAKFPGLGSGMTPTTRPGDPSSPARFVLASSSTSSSSGGSSSRDSGRAAVGSDGALLQATAAGAPSTAGALSGAPGTGSFVKSEREDLRPRSDFERSLDAAGVPPARRTAIVRAGPATGPVKSEFEASLDAVQAAAEAGNDADDIRLDLPLD